MANQRGQKKSPFIGRTELLVNNGKSILYPRYRDVSEILQGAEAISSRKSNLAADTSSHQQQASAALLPKAKTNEHSAKLAKLPAKGSKEAAPPSQDDPPNGTVAAAVIADTQPGEPGDSRKRKKRRTAENRAQPFLAEQAPSGEAAAAIAPAAAAPAGDVGADTRIERKKKKRRKNLAAEGDTAPVHTAHPEATTAPDGKEEIGRASVREAKKRKPRTKTREERAAAKAELARAKVSGPGNAREAAVIRQALGFTKAEAEALVAPSGQQFAFGFNIASSPAEAQSPAADAGPAGGGADPGAGADGAGAAVNGHAQDDAGSKRPREGPRPGAARSRKEQELQEKLARVMASGGKPDGADGAVPRRVFVGGMPFGYEEDDVREYWSYCGEIEDLDLMRFPDSGRFKGIAFVTFATEEAYQAALECNGEWLGNTQLKVEACKSAGPARSKGRSTAVQPGSERAGPAPKTPGYHVAYVGNVAFEADKQALAAAFEGCAVSFVRMHTDKDTGKPKGFAHVHFEDEASLDRAMEFDGTELLGRCIKVGYAQPKKT